jgi:hypothetical protein
MKWFTLTLAVALSSVSFAADSCDADCAEVVQKCSETCKKALKKDAPDKINFCKDKCKEFESECKKDCKEDKKK